MAVSREPYYHHMPKDNPATATLYAAELGGEHHDISKSLRQKSPLLN